MPKKLTTVKIPSYLEYLDLLQQKARTSMQDFSHYLESVPISDALFSTGPCPYFLLDYRTGQYLLISENCKDMVGHSAEAFKEGGVSFMLSLNHPDDRQIFFEDIFRKRLEFLRSIPVAEHKQYRYSFNHRIRRADGKYMHLLQQSIILESDETGNPLLIFGFYSDITPYKSDNKIISTITRYTEGKGYSTVHTEVYPKEEEGIFSKREKQILKLIAEGHNSRHVADKLHISLNTVRTHRRNMLQKTNSKNVAELLKMARAEGIV